MGQVSEVSRQYAAGSRQAEASAQELAHLAESMRGSMDTFTVEPGIRPGHVSVQHHATADADVTPRVDELV